MRNDRCKVCQRHPGAPGFGRVEILIRTSFAGFKKAEQKLYRATLCGLCQAEHLPVLMANVLSVIHGRRLSVGEVETILAGQCDPSI